ncbi:MAG: hypothetical protein J6S67_23230 [Methanobrevibacter sp.]|nr:hypothetical protein [Methanobrevibacter sp.]
MNTKATPKITKLFVEFGALFQLPEPPAEYIQAIQKELSTKGWTLGRISEALEELKYSQDYNQAARFNKYPSICDLITADYELRR